MATQLERRTASRAALIASARELITQGGFTEASCQEIGARAGKSRAAVNYAFGTKGGLLAAVIDDSAALWKADLRAAERGDGLLPWLDALWAAWRTDPCRSRLVCMLLFEATGPSRQALPQTIALQDRALNHLRVELTDLQLVGLLPPTLDPKRAAQTILTAATGLITQHATSPNIDADAAYQAQRDLFTAGWHQQL